MCVCVCVRGMSIWRVPPSQNFPEVVAYGFLVVFVHHSSVCLPNSVVSFVLLSYHTLDLVCHPIQISVDQDGESQVSKGPVHPMFVQMWM